MEPHQTEPGNLPPLERIQAFLQPAFPGGQLRAARKLEGSFSNFTHLVEVILPDGEVLPVVLRRYNPANGDMELKANIEFHTLAWLHGNGIPVAKPIRLDSDGHLLGLPGFAMHFLPGRLQMWPDAPPAHPLDFARKAGAMLARIHALPCDPPPPFLADGNAWTLWFLQSGEMPAPLRAHPDGRAIWDAVRAHLPDFKQSKNALHHGDYWEGNLLWQGEAISAVMDWEEAGYGEPGADVAYFLMGMALVGQPGAARAFLRAYETAAGGPVAHLAFWKLAAAVRPIYLPEGWIDAPPFAGRFRHFVATARRQLAAGAKRGLVL